MAISSVSGAAVSHALPPQARVESRIEGSTPDGDGDSDDISSSHTVTQTSNTSQISETLGNIINVMA